MDNKLRQRQIALFLGDDETALGLITEKRALALVDGRKAVWRKGQAAVQLVVSAGRSDSPRGDRKRQRPLIRVKSNGADLLSVPPVFEAGKSR